MKLEKLFESAKIGRVQVRNRMVMAPMAMGYAIVPGGFVNEQCVAFYEERAKGGVGLIIVGGSIVVRGSEPFPTQLCLYDDAYIPGLRRLAERVKAQGARVSIQLFHPGKRLSEFRTDVESVGPSDIPHPLTGIAPRELSVEEIKAVVEAYGNAAKRCQEAGFDGIEIHGAHGYLPNQFLSPWTNRRSDQYGGSVENRTRFSREIIEDIRKKTGPDFLLGFRMDGYNGVEGGITIEDAKAQAPLLEGAGADYLHVSAGFREGHHWQFITRIQPAGLLVPLAAEIKKVASKPVIAVGKLGDPVIAEGVLKENKADFVAIGRALIADPELPNKARDGRFDDIRTCIYCNWGCLELRVTPPDFASFCSVNPTCGHEHEMKAGLKPAPVPKKIMVIGGGLAGMEAARTLAERGHRVSLYEKEGRLGGQWNLVSVCSPGVAGLTRYLERRTRSAGVNVVLNRAVDRELIRKEKPDAAVVATGAKQRIPPVQGAEGKNVVLANDVLAGRAEVGQDVVVVGGRLAGLDVAILLSERGKKKVSVVSRGKIARDAPYCYKLALKEALVRQGVYMYPDSVLHSISPNGVNVISDGELMFLKADTVVLAVGSEPLKGIEEEIKGLVGDIRVIGDCVEPRNAYSAIHEGAEVGRDM